MRAVPAATIVSILQVRAEEICGGKDHRIGTWRPAKKKWGKGALQAYCPDCASTVIVLPNGGTAHIDPFLQGKERRVAESFPAIIGDAIFEDCLFES